MSLKNGRPRPKAYTPAAARAHRAAQSARAILAGRGERETHWTRIARCFADLDDATAATKFAHQLGLDTVPLRLLDAAFPPAPETAPAAPTPAPTADELYVEAAADACHGTEVSA